MHYEIDRTPLFNKLYDLAIETGNLPEPEHNKEIVALYEYELCIFWLQEKYGKNEVNEEMTEENIIDYFVHLKEQSEKQKKAHESRLKKFQSKFSNLDKSNHKKCEQSYSLKQVAIAYAFLKTVIDAKSYKQILKLHTKSKSDKILQKRVRNVSDLTKTTGNRTTDTKHLHDLLEAKRLLLGMKNKKAVNDIEPIIVAFQTSYDRER